MQLRYHKEYGMRLIWSNGDFPASASIERRKNSVAGASLACCPRLNLRGNLSKPDSGLHERPSREKDDDHRA